MSKKNRPPARHNDCPIGRYRALAASIAACGLALTAFTLCIAQPADEHQSPIEYRRIYVPAEKIDAWPRDGEKYVPVEAARVRIVDPGGE